MLLTVFLALFVGLLIGFTLGRKLQKTPKTSLRKNEVKMSEEEEEELAESDLKMVFLVREDLKMSKGKIAAQVGHAACGLFRNALESKNDHHYKCLEVWETYGAKKITLKIDSLEDLKAIQTQVKSAKLNQICIQDAVKP